jgi:aspartate 4-decarboxylase
MDRSRDEERRYERLSPFELKDRLVAAAAAHARRGTRAMLDAGRGNPNWVATAPRAAFFALGRFALAEAERASLDAGLGGPPRVEGIGARFAAFLDAEGDAPARRLLREALRCATQTLGFEPDRFVHELADGVLGGHYPSPARMLEHCERVVRAYLARELCAGRPPAGRFELFATEGAAAGMRYVFESLVHNRLLAPGDRIALGTPIFTPYLEIPRLAEYGFDVLEIAADERDGWQYPDRELDKLADPAVKALVVVNPGNPTAVAMRRRSVERLVALVASRRPDLVVVTDDVYATFVDGYRSLLAELPRNTIGVYSFSKHFGATGWRLGVVALHEDNALDARIAALPEAERARVDARYASLALEPRRLKLIERIAADSRQVALHHVAGLSTPQQVQMALFALLALADPRDEFKRAAQGIVRRRCERLFRGLGLPCPDDPLFTAYYVTIDLESWLRAEHGEAFVAQLTARHHPLDLVFRLADRHAIVLLPGKGFDAPAWSVRVSLANLPNETYERIGAALRAVALEYVAEWRAAGGR